MSYTFAEIVYIRQGSTCAL